MEVKLRGLDRYEVEAIQYDGTNSDEICQFILEREPYTQIEGAFLNKGTDKKMMAVIVIPSGENILVREKEWLVHVEVPYGNQSSFYVMTDEERQDRYFTIYDTRPDEREWIELNKSTWDTKIDSIRNAKIPTHCFKDEIPTGLNLTEYLEGLNIFDPEDLLNTLLRKIAVEPVPKEVQWWEAQERFENLIGAEFCRGGGCPSRSSITSVTLQRSMPTPAQMS